MRTNTPEASPIGTCRGSSSQTIDLGNITLGTAMLIAITMKTNIPEANLIVTDKVSSSQTIDPRNSTLGIVMLTAIGIGLEKGLSTDQVAQEIGPQVDIDLKADTGYTVLTLETIEMMLQRILPGRRTMLKEIMILAMVVTTEGAARRP